MTIALSSVRTFVLVILSTVTSISHVLLRIHDDYLQSYLMSVQWSDQRMEEERTYGFIACSDPLTTNDETELDLWTSIDAIDTIMYHGVGHLTGFFEPDFVRKMDPPFHQEPYLLTRSQGLSLLKHVVNKHAVAAILERLLGENPALVQLYMKQMNDQNTHRETWFEASSSMYSHSFVSMYSLVLSMDSAVIQVGPGTHRCHNNFVDGVEMVLAPGDVLLLNTVLLHRIRGSVVTISFASSPDVGRAYHRMLPVGPRFLLSWSLHGLTLTDLRSGAGAIDPFSCVFGKGWSWLQTKASIAANNADHGNVKAYLDRLLLPLTNWPSLSIEGKEYAPTFQYLRAWIECVQSLFIKLTLSSIPVLLFLRLPSSQKNVSVMRFVSTALIIFVTVVGGCLLLYYTASISSWAKADLAAQRPFPDQGVHFSEDYIEALSAVKQEDVLVGGRLESAGHLAAHNQFVQYHTGNRNWYKATYAWGWWYLLYKSLPPVFAHTLVLEAVRGRRILEANDFGDFEELRPNEVFDFGVQHFEEMWRWPHKNSGSVPLRHPCRGYTRTQICKIRPAVFGHFYRDPQKVRSRQSSVGAGVPFGVGRLAPLPSVRRCLSFHPSDYNYEEPEEDDPWRLDHVDGEKVEVNFQKPMYPWSRGGFLVARSWIDCTVTGVSSDLSLVGVKNINNVTKVVHSSTIRRPVRARQSPYPPIPQTGTMSSRVLVCNYKSVRKWADN